MPERRDGSNRPGHLRLPASWSSGSSFISLRVIASRGCAGWFGQTDRGQCEGLLAGRICAPAFTATRGNVMYIGVGAIVLIVLVVLLILFLRRRV
jgi:hypothetical protein